MQTDYGISECTFAQIMDEFGSAAYRLALSKTGNSELANDIYQQTFLLLLEKKPRFSHRNQLRVWLLKSAQRLAAKSRRCADIARTVPLDAVTDAGGWDSSNLELLDILGALSENCRQQPFSIMSTTCR